MPDEIDGHLVATDMALKIMAHLLHRRGALDAEEFARELEARAKLLAGTTRRVASPRPRRAPRASLTSWPGPCASRSSA
jgi:plasmid stabilization system protein ParE